MSIPDTVERTFREKLNDVMTSPFLITYSLSWGILNYKFFAIYFSDVTLKNKLFYLENDYSLWNSNIVFAFIIALFFVTIYPFFANAFLRISYWHKKSSILIRIKGERSKPISVREALKLQRDMRVNDEVTNQLTKENSQLKEKVEELENLIISKTKKTEELENEIRHLQSLESEYKKKENQFDRLGLTTDNIVDGKETSDSSTVEESAPSNDTVENREILNTLTDPEKEVIDYLSNWNYTTRDKDTFLAEITHATSLTRSQITIIIKRFIKIGIMKEDKLNILISDKGFYIINQKIQQDKDDEKERAKEAQSMLASLTQVKS